MQRQSLRRAASGAILRAAIGIRAVVVAAPHAREIGLHALNHVLRDKRDLRAQIGGMVDVRRHQHQLGRADQTHAEDKHGRENFDQRDALLMPRTRHGRDPC